MTVAMCIYFSDYAVYYSSLELVLFSVATPPLCFHFTNLWNMDGQFLFLTN